MFLPMRAAVILLLCLTIQSAPPPQPPQPPTMAAAQARLAANDTAGAITILEALVAATPASVPAWTLLGSTRQQAKDYDNAIAAFRKVAELRPQAAPQMHFNVAAAYAGKQDRERAFEWLQKARDSRQVDMSQLDATREFDAIRKDPRFAKLRPTDADFANPFVEEVRVIREWRGETANEQFGWIARNLGDVDGDGVADIVTSAPTKAIGGAAAGRVYVYSTATGSLKWSADGKPGDRFGIGVEAAGDTNRDGIPDVIAAAPGGGYARVHSGDDGRVLLTMKAEDPADAYGRHVAGVGDVDRDGYADVIVGAPNNKAAGAAAGRAYIYSGKDGRVLLTLTGERAGDNFGSAVAGWSDGKQIMILVGAPGGGPTRRGRTYVYSSLTATPAFLIEAESTSGALGAMFLSVPGDVDGDGVADAYASDFADSAKGPGAGRTFIHSGKDGKRLLALAGEGAGEGFGTSPAVAGDVDGDGHADLVVGAWQHSSAAASGGRVYLYSGKDGRLMKTYTSRIPGDTLGFDAVAIGDVDGDGSIDFLVTSAWSGVRGFHSGRMFVISSGITRVMK